MLQSWRNNHLLYLKQWLPSQLMTNHLLFHSRQRIWKYSILSILLPLGTMGTTPTCMLSSKWGTLLTVVNIPNLTSYLWQPFFPKVSWPPLEDVQVTDRGLFADPEKKSLLSAATKVKHYSPAIGTELSGIDLRQLSDSQKDELYVLDQRDGPDFTFLYIVLHRALLVAERGVVCKQFHNLVHRAADIPY